MICYLTSSPTYYPNTALNPANGFVENLKKDLPAALKCVFIASDPDDHAGMDGYAAEMRTCLEDAGFRFTAFTVLDGRNEDSARAREAVLSAGLVILAGGHVPTQNRFFSAIGLRDILRGFSGVVMGISAGTMNSADTVYAMPELEGEAVDPDFRRDLPGLGLTDINIVPHYQYLETCTLDGMNMIHGIACADSMTRRLLALPDGSYLRIENGVPCVFGKALRIEGGLITQISDDGDILPLSV